MGSALLPLFDVVCVVLVVGGLFKVTAPEPARESLSLAGVHVSGAVARTLGVFEIAVGTAAAISPRPLPAALLAIVYAGFCGFALRLLTAGKGIDCGCFGGSGARVGATHVILTAIGCATAAVAALVHPPGVRWLLTHASLESVVTAIGIVAASFAVYALFTLYPSAWRSYGAS